MTTKTTKRKARRKPGDPPGKRGNPNLRKGEQPPWLKEHSFAVRPDHINRLGVASDVITLRKMIQKLGNEGIVIGKVKTEGNEEQEVVMSRFERILMDWFNSQSFDKQQAIMQYGIGKVPDQLNISGELKTIHVTLKKKDPAPPPIEGQDQ